MRTRTDLLARFAAAVPAIMLAVAAGGVEPSPTIANLQAAFATDVTAQARYEAFAGRAEQEGRRDEAALFRAAAHAEGVRARMHSEVIRRLGSDPRRPSVDAPGDVRDTRANLRSILTQENAERAAVYPRFVDQARRDAVPEAILAFTLAHHAEAGLVQLYQHAVAGRMPSPRYFHVCETCGHVVRGDPPERCPISLTNRAAFTQVG